MKRDTFLCLLLLVGSSLVWAQQGSENEEPASTCKLSSRFKAFKKYSYLYTTESRNGVTGTSSLRNGPKITCQVELEVPQTCSFVLHTRDCVLSEVSSMDDTGLPVYSPAANTEAFRAAMDKNPLKFTAEQVTDLLTDFYLFPEPDETVNILNIKRGVVSALVVPVMEQGDLSPMSTVHGVCPAEHLVVTRKDIATDVSVSLDMTHCDQFTSRALPSSPLALLQHLQGALSKMIRSSHQCNYQFDNKRKHMTSVECTEKHLYLPFSHADNGISSVITQTLTLQDNTRINNRIFEVDPQQVRRLYLDPPEERSAVQSSDAASRSLQELLSLTDGQRRPQVFHQLVSALRSLDNLTLSHTVETLAPMGDMITWQALLQCGTPECTSAFLQRLRSVEGLSLGGDALVYALSLQPLPDAHRVTDMLSMAQYRQSKAIMYALANTVNRFYNGYDRQDGSGQTAELSHVSLFMESLVTDCSQEPDTAYLALRVIGVMGAALQDQDSSPALLRALLRCARNQEAPLLNQKAAVQAFRLMEVNEEVAAGLMEVYRGEQGSIDKRIAAYLLLMKNPSQAVVKDIISSLKDMEHLYLERYLVSFVISHLNNILASTEPKLQELRDYIDMDLPGQYRDMDVYGLSMHGRLEAGLGTVQGNAIFDSANHLPKELLLETTLRVMDLNQDLFQVGLEGEGFNPTLEALFGEKGFFPDAVSRAVYWANQNTPEALKKVLDRILPEDEEEEEWQRKRRQVPEELTEQLMEGVNKVVQEVRSSSPEAAAYLRLLGEEVGYVNLADMKHAVHNMLQYYHTFLGGNRKILQQLMSGADNQMFVHYIFMENSFSLPTASGLPLKFSLAGVVAPGAKGGLSFSSGMRQLSFMPSLGLDVITEMGVKAPELLEAAVQMHTTLYAESSVNAKITVNRNHVKLSIPAPTASTQLLSVSNEVLSVSSTGTEVFPSLDQDRTDSTHCQPLFVGLNYCSVVSYSNASNTDQAPYYPLTGTSRFAVEIQPTGEVSEYSASILAETLREGKEGRQKVDSLKISLKAEGVDSAEATASVKYNRNKNTLTSELNIPDYDLEAGLRLSVTNTNTKGKTMRAVTVDVTNKNVPQLTLVARTRMDMMKDALVQLEVQVPSLQTDATVSATLRTDPALTLGLEAALNAPQTSSLHKVTVKYDEDKLEVEVNTDLSCELQTLLPNAELHHRQLQKLLDDLLDQTVAKTDMKLRHIVTKGIQAAHIWVDRLSSSEPNLRSRRSISDLTLPPLPEKLFLQSDSVFRYQFNKDRWSLSLPVPLGGQSSEDLGVPSSLSIPELVVPEVGLHVPATRYPLPAFTVPRTWQLTLPLLGLAEYYTKVNSNLYNWEATLSGGNTTVDDVPSYMAQYKVMAQSPLNLLSYKLEGTGMMSGRIQDNLKYLVNSSFSHSLVEASFSGLETLTITDTVLARASYKVEASSPLGLRASLSYAAKSTSGEEVTGDGTLETSLKAGPLFADTSYTHSYALHPRARRGRGESVLRVVSPLGELHNAVQGVYENAELSVVSKTNALDDALRHVAELKYKDAQLTLKCNAAAAGLGASLQNKVELGVSGQMAVVRVESQADDDTNRLYSLVTSSLDSNGLEVNSEASLTFAAGRGLHKASLTVGGSGLLTSGTNSIQCSPVTFENVFDGVIDGNGATLSSKSKAMAEESRGELNVEGKVTAAEASLSGILKGYAHDASTRNTLDMVLNNRALTLSSSVAGSLQQMKTENSNTLTLTLWTLALRSKTENFICEDVYYKHDVKVNMKPFITSVDLTNDLKLYDANLNNEGHLKVEPIKVDLTGSVKGSYGDSQEIKHAYEIKYDDLAGAVKWSTSANIAEAQLSHNCELEFAGLSSKSICEARVNSEPLILDGTVRTMAQPFSFTVDALVNGNGQVELYRKHIGQVFSKLLVKVEPLALAYSHDYRVSTLHKLEDGETTIYIDNKFDGLLTPSEQSLTWKNKNNLNDHAYSQDVAVYNDPEKTGAEFAAALLTDLFSQSGAAREKRSEPEKQEFNVAGFLKYDKSSDCHIIQIPFIESFPLAFEQLKSALVNALESLEDFINSLDMNHIMSRFRAGLDELPTQVQDFMTQLDMDNRVNEVKETLAYLTKEFAVTMEDLELAMENLRGDLEKSLTDLAVQIKDLFLKAKDYVETGDYAHAVSTVLSNIGQELRDFDEKYRIRDSLVKLIAAIQDIIGQIDVQKLAESSVAWLQDADALSGVKENVLQKLSDFKEAVYSFDVIRFFQDLRDHILSFDWSVYFEQLSSQVPTSEIAGVIESMKDVVVNWIEEYEIPNKLNAVYFYLRDLVIKYDIDQKFKDLLDQAVVLIKEFKMEETVQAVADALKAINFEYAFDKMMGFLTYLTDQLKAIDFKQSIDELNERISSTLQSMKDFDYNAFVDYANEKIAELTNDVNEQIKAYELVEKVEAVREFIRELQTAAVNYIEKLKETKVAELVRRLNAMLDTTAYSDIKMKAQEMLEDMRQRIVQMDIRDEMRVHLQRASESYTNIVAYVSLKLDDLMEWIRGLKDHEIIDQIKEAINGVLEALKMAELEFQSFTVPLTDLAVPAFTVNLNRLQDISLPAQISIPEFTVLGSYTIPAFTIDFEAMKAKILEAVDYLRELEITIPEPEDVFGELRALYLNFDIPDFTLPEITLSEIKFPAINVPKLNLDNFEITMLPIPDIKLPEIPGDICIPVFGKLHGQFRVNSPHYVLLTTASFENSTTAPKNQQFTATLTSQAKSTIEFLDHALDATARLEAPRMKKLLFTETLKASHAALEVDHAGSLTITGSSAEATSKTTTKVTTPVYAANLVNNIAFTLSNGVSAAARTARAEPRADMISATMDTIYNHDLNIPSAEISSQAAMTQNVAAMIESGTVSLTVGTDGNGKWSIQDYTDEGTHKSNLEFTINSGTARLTFEGETDSMALKSKQRVNAESVILSHVTVEARAETEAPFVRSSVMVLNGEARVADLRIAVTAAHNAELTGRLSGSISNTLEFLARPFEIALDSKNKGNSKIILPLRLTGKVDLQHDYSLALNSERQRAGWLALARFNQYKYNHNVVVDNNEQETFLHVAANGEANLEFLTVPLSVPEMTVPYLDMTTPEVTEFSLWEHAGLRTLLTTPQQSFDMNMKLHYHKNPDMHSFDLDLEPFYNTIHHNAMVLRGQFERSRDAVVELLKGSYNQAKVQYVKHKMDTSGQPPRIFTVPGYKVPVLNIQVSAFTAELPAFNYFVPKEVSTPSFKVPAMGFSVPSYTLVLPSLELPVIHVPETLSELTLPAFTLPDMQNRVLVPAMGNVTYDFSFKSSVISVSANAGLYNQSDVVARFGASSVSVFEILNGKLEGTSSLARKRGIKLATSVALEHRNVEANHDCTVSLSKRSAEASVNNGAKVHFPSLSLEFNQELVGSTKTKPNVGSKFNLKYMFNNALMDAVGKGNVEHNLALEALTSHLSLETSTKAKTDVTMMSAYDVAGELVNEANFYLNANGLRSTVKTDLSTNLDRRPVEEEEEGSRNKRSAGVNVLRFGTSENLALEVSLRRAYATLDTTSDNNADLGFFTTNGKHVVKATFEFVPLTTLKATMHVDAVQPSSLGHSGLLQDLNLDVSYEKQSLSWSGKEQLGSVILASDVLLSNDESDVRADASASLEGHLAFLKAARLPVYQKPLWDVLKLDQVTHVDRLQFLNVSTSVVYTKSQDGLEFAIPATLFENGVTFSIPEFTLAPPTWLSDILDAYEGEPAAPDGVTLPQEFSVPAFHVPFTTLHVEPFTIDLKNLNVPKVISTTSFDLTLPGMPAVSVPAYHINTEFLQGKMSFLAFKTPRHDVTISSFTLPTSFSLGELTVDLQEMAKHLSNMELPTVTIPEQRMEIPEMALHLPSSLFIPAFGSLSATVKLSTPFYNVSSTAGLEKKDSSLVTSLKSICTSTMIFMEYDLDASSTLGFDDGLSSLMGKINLIHSDLNVDWQHVYTHNSRMKRQTSSTNALEYRHTLNVDVTSPSFADLSFRFASIKDGVTASVSSPSSGFLGLHLQRRSQNSQLYGRVFCRYLSTPGKDADILVLKATLRNSVKLNLQGSWNLEVLNHMLEGLKERLPAATDAALRFLNKYHVHHLGFDLSRAAMKLKNAASNAIERLYHRIPATLGALQTSLQQLGDQARETLRQAADAVASVNLQDLWERAVSRARQALSAGEQNLDSLLNAAAKFLSDTTFSVPGFQEKMTGLEIYERLRRAVSAAVDRAVQRFFRLAAAIGDAVSDLLGEVEFTIPRTEVVVSGRDVLEKMRSVREQALHLWDNLSTEELLVKVRELLELLLKKAEDLVASLAAQHEDLTSRLQGVYDEAQEGASSAKQSLDEAKRGLAQLKDLAKKTLQDAYNHMNLHNLNHDLREMVSALQSHLHGGLNDTIDLLKRWSLSLAPYVKMSSKKLDVEIPLPFYWKAFSELPTQERA